MTFQRHLLFLYSFAIAAVLSLPALDGATVVLSSTPNPATFGAPVTLTASLNPSNAAGKVTFYDGTLVLGTSPVAGGQATLTTRLRATGIHKLQARYGTGVQNQGAVSTPIPQTLNSVPASGFTSSTLSMGIHALVSSVGDFDGDGKTDLVATGATNLVSVALGKGDGTFGVPIISTAPGTAAAWYASIQVADFDGDGKQDLAVGNFGDNYVVILFGNGDGTFGNPVQLPTTYGMVLAADFNEDGIPDVAIGHPASHSIAVVLGQGNRTFGTPVSYPTGAGDADVSVPIKAGDLNGDGAPDLLTVIPTFGDTNRTLVVLLGNGDGTFQPFTSRLSEHRLLYA